jgi:beta-mannanase
LQHRERAPSRRCRKTITKASSLPHPPRFALASPAVRLLAVLLLILSLYSGAAAETTFRNCTYDGRFNHTSSLISINDIAGLNGSVSWGVSLDTSAMSIDDYIGALGRDRSPAIINLYFDMAHLGGINNPLNCQIAAAKAAGAILMLTVEPWSGLHTVDATATTELGRLCRDVNEAGVPVFVRFAHEMNGDWYPWGARPGEYRDVYRAVAAAVKAAAENTAMVWAPNTGVGYPYNGAGKYLPTDTKGSRFAQMDTNRDGKLDEGDDPFTPYYPGDDVVDWIGISLYSKRNNGRGDKYANDLADRSDLKMYIENPNTKFNLYQKFAEEKKKPFMIAETASAYYPEFAKGDGEVTIKRAWWKQFWSKETLDEYPLLKVHLPIPTLTSADFLPRPQSGSSSKRQRTRARCATTPSSGTRTS